MKQVTISLYTFAELSKDAQKVARQECCYDIASILDCHCEEITASYEAFCSEVEKGNFDLNKHDCPLTGMCYDQDIIAALQANTKVYWKNKGYKVLVQNNQLYSIFIHNDSMCMLQESEYTECFTGD